MSKFKDLMAQARQREAEPERNEAPPVVEMPQPPKNGAAPTRRTTEQAQPEAAQPEPAQRSAPEPEPVLRGRGRPPGHAGGKRSHPDYEQVSAYLPRQMHREIKLALLQNEVQTGQKREFSTLVEGLLTVWLQEQEQKSR